MKIQTQIFLIFSLILFCINAFSQNKPIQLIIEKDYSKQRSPYGVNGKDNVSVEYKYYFKFEGEEMQNVGYTGKKLKPYISSSPEAIKYLKKYRSARYKSTILQWTFIVPTIIYIGSVYSTGEPFSGGQVVLLVLGVSSLTGYFIYDSKIEKTLKLAIESYNKSIGELDYKSFPKDYNEIK
jgi:hypothetical protein